jgi:hypothetical protein
MSDEWIARISKPIPVERAAAFASESEIESNEDDGFPF